jgi:FkbM family methyltransferase
MNPKQLARRAVRKAYSLTIGQLDANYVRDRLSRMKDVLTTPYWRMVFQDALNFRKAAYFSPPLRILEEDGQWLVLEIADYRFVWPAEYRIFQGLRDLYHETLAPAQYNPHAYEYGDVKINVGDWVVDGGACEGFFTHHALKCGANVLAVEPVPRLAEALRLTFAKEIHQGRVRVLEGALSDADGPLHLTILANEIYSASLGTSGTQIVSAYSLDSILFRHKMVPTIDFVKMDIEGAEVAAIRGATMLLHQIHPRLSIAVYHDFLNAKTVKSLIYAAHPQYQVRWRGIFIREDFGAPRPFMLHASCFDVK